MAATATTSPKAKWHNVGDVRVSQKDGKTLYLKVRNDTTLKAGDILQLQDPVKGLQASVDRGTLSEDAAREILSYTKFNVVLPPRR